MSEEGRDASLDRNEELDYGTPFQHDSSPPLDRPLPIPHPPHHLSHPGGYPIYQPPPPPHFRHPQQFFAVGRPFSGFPINSRPIFQALGRPPYGPPPPGFLPPPPQLYSDTPLVPPWTGRQRSKKRSEDVNEKLQALAPPRPSTKPCNCRRSKCLKLYCDCFARREVCGAWCSCDNCHNTDSDGHTHLRRAAVTACIERNPMAFQPKVRSRLHYKGCHCRKSGCLKKYCECFEAGITCSQLCKCLDCANTTLPVMPRRKAPSSRRQKKSSSPFQDDQQPATWIQKQRCRRRRRGFYPPNDSVLSSSEPSDATSSGSSSEYEIPIQVKSEPSDLSHFEGEFLNMTDSIENEAFKQEVIAATNNIMEKTDSENENITEETPNVFGEIISTAINV